MNSATIHSSSFRLTQGASTVSGAVIPGSLSATFTPSGSLTPGTTYTVTVTTAVQDDEGVALASESSWSFTTAGTPPVTRQQRRRRGWRVLHRHGGLRLGAGAAGGHAEGVPRRLPHAVPLGQGLRGALLRGLASAPSMADVIAADEGLRAVRAVLAPVVAQARPCWAPGARPRGSRVARRRRHPLLRGRARIAARRKAAPIKFH